MNGVETWFQNHYQDFQTRAEGLTEPQLRRLLERNYSLKTIYFNTLFITALCLVSMYGGAEAAKKYELLNAWVVGLMPLAALASCLVGPTRGIMRKYEREILLETLQQKLSTQS